MSINSIYGSTTRLAHAEKGKFAATVFMVDEDKHLLYCFTPGVRLSEDQFDLWFADFSAPELEVDTISVSLYDGENSMDWPIPELQEYFQEQLEQLVSFLHGIEAGTYFT